MGNQAELYNIEAELEVLSSLMSKPGKFHDISRIIKADDFYRETHKLIYKTMAGMIIANEPLDMTNLAEKLKHEGILEKVGGLSAITNIGGYGLVARIESQAKIIAEYARRRNLVEKAQILAAMAADSQNDIDQLVYDFASDISGITADADDKTKDAKETVMEVLALIDRRSKRQENLLNTGLADIDKMVTSLEAGQLIIIAGRPAHGKTALAGTVAVNMAKRGKKVLMFSMEMTRDELANRFVCRLSGVPSEKTKKPNDMTADEWNKYYLGINEYHDLPIMINEQGALTPSDVSSIATRCKNSFGLDVIFIDYLQLMNGGRKTDNRVQEISYITRSLKNLAVALKVPIVLLSQLNRANDRENRPPKLTDLRDSGSIEQDANTVMLIYREPRMLDDGTTELTNLTHVNIAKQRDGACGIVDLTFIPSRSYFVDYIDEGKYMGKGFKAPL